MDVTDRAELKEKFVHDALDRLDVGVLDHHLAQVQLDEATFDLVLAIALRSGRLVFKKPDLEREQKRDAFLATIRYHAEQVGSVAIARFEALAMTVSIVEQGYRAILDARSKLKSAAMLPELRLAALIANATETLKEVDLRLDDANRANRDVATQMLRIQFGDGLSAAPDGVLNANSDAAFSALHLEADQNGWFSEDRILVLPEWPHVGAHEVQIAQPMVASNLLWQRWRAVEERYRYLGGNLAITNDSVPLENDAAKRTLVCRSDISDAEFDDFVANERLSWRLTQTFLELSIHYGRRISGHGIDSPLDLPPASFVSADEAHANIMLSEALGAATVDDYAEPAGLRLVEWICGYAVLRQLARDRWSKGQAASLPTLIRREELTALLERLGLKDGRAGKFLASTLQRAGSRDLFNQPLIQIADGSILLFGPTLVYLDIVRVVLAVLGRGGKHIDQKGKTFEAQVISFFEERSMRARALKFNKGAETYQVDAMVEWGSHILLFECKNLSLSGHSPLAAYDFDHEMRKAIKQLKRLKAAVIDYPEEALKRTERIIRGALSFGSLPLHSSSVCRWAQSPSQSGDAVSTLQVV